MASMTKEEYLKKYLDGGDEQKKKKKRRPKVKSSKVLPRMRIVDDDIDMKALLPENLHNTLEEDVGDNDPTVADIVDERPEEIRLLEQYRTDRRWRQIGKDEQKSENESDNGSQQEWLSLRAKRHDTDSDESPPRQQRHDSESDQSPPRKKGHDSESDQSPPKRRRHDSGSDQSPPRRKQYDSDSDQSVSRIQKTSKSNQSPPRKREYSGSKKTSPVKVKSEPRTEAQEKSKGRRRKSRFHSDSDQSPPCKKASDSGGDLSPVRRPKGMKGGDVAEMDNKGRAQKTLSGATAGLSSAKQMREEARLMREREQAIYDKLDDKHLGKNAKTVIRERKRKTQEEKEKEERDAEKQAELQTKYEAWNKGLKQSRLQDEAVEAAIAEMSKPVARHKGDTELEAHLKAQHRDGDPMAAYIKQKVGKQTGQKERPRYKGPQPPQNRFNIWPGYRWDGVDRSNGFEKMIVVKAAERKAVKEIAYKWSVEDM